MARRRRAWVWWSMSLFPPIDPVMDVLVDAAGDELASLTRALYAGRLNLSQWSTSIAATLKDAHLANSLVAVGGADNLGPANYGRAGGTLADEYRHLYDFAQAIADGDVSEAQALARAQQYARASQQAYWREYAQREMRPEWSGLPVLKNAPRDGRTQCHGNCNCQLRTDEDGIHWELFPGESCPDCQALAAGGPYRPR
jgi:hypothetical protein